MVKTPALLAHALPRRTWRIRNASNRVYLTFDDGPIPKVTPWVLDTLKEAEAKATFFCIGDNIRKHPDIFRRIISEGHAIGNHTFHHLNGRKTTSAQYLEDVARCEREIQNSNLTPQTSNLTPQTSPLIPHPSYLFRPPYGRLTSKQARTLIDQGYELIMWDVLSYDFDAKLSKEQCLQNVLKHVRPGSIVVLHDSLKAEEKLRYCLPRILDFISEKGWKCDKIDGSGEK